MASRTSQFVRTSYSTLRLVAFGVAIAAAMTACGSSSDTTASTSGTRTKNAALETTTSVDPGVAATSAPTASQCAVGGTCSIGDIGPGGGIVVATNGKFAGAGCGDGCNYLEVARQGWSASLASYACAKGTKGSATADPRCSFDEVQSIPGLYRGGQFKSWINADKTMAPFVTLTLVTDLNNDVYWSSSRASSGWGLQFPANTGVVESGRPSNSAYVRAVRPFNANQSVAAEAGSAVKVPAVLGANFDGAANYSVISGQLPAGLTLDATSGVISGNPTGEANNAVTISAKGVNGGVAVGNITFKITPAKLTISPTTQTVNGALGKAITPTSTFSTTAFAGAISYAVTGGELPKGLVLDTTSGVVSGTPLVGLNTTVTLTAKGAQSGVITTSISFNIAGAKASVSPTSISGEVGVAIPAITFTTENFSGALTFAVTSGALPAGVSLEPATGKLSGTPTTALTTAKVGITVAGAAGGTANVSLQITVAPVSCARGGACKVGDVTPMGGIVFYAPEKSFSVPGTKCNTNCKYLEAAQSNWFSGPGAGLDPTLPWSYVGANNQFPQAATLTRPEIGTGMSNTLAMKKAGATLATTGIPGFDKLLADGWFIPSKDELTALLNATPANLKLLTTIITDKETRYWSSTEYVQGYNQACDRSGLARCAVFVYRDMQTKKISDYFSVKDKNAVVRLIRAS